MECSDAFRCFSCSDCGILAVANPTDSIWICRGCGNTTNFSPIEIPYAYKLLIQELESMCIGSRILTKNRLIGPAVPSASAEEEAEAEAEAEPKKS